MKRSFFDLWGSRLDKDDFARALAALGVLSASVEASIPGLSWSAAARANLLRAIGDAQGPVECSFEASASRPADLSRSYDARVLAAAWRSVVVDEGRRPRLEIARPGRDMFDNPWLVEQLSQPCVSAASVYLRLEDTPLITDRSWPLRVGLLDDPSSRELGQEVHHSALADSRVELVAMAARGAACDLLLLPFGLQPALASLPQETAIACNFAVVLGGIAGGAGDIRARLAALRAATRSGGAALASIDEASRLKWLTALLDSLSFGAPLDVALFDASRAVSARAPLVAASRLPARIADASEPSPPASRPRERPVRRATPPSVSRPIDGHGPKLHRSPIFEAMPLRARAEPPPPVGSPAPIPEPDATAPESPSRAIQARIFDCTSVAKPVLLAKAMRSGAPHLVEARIGHPGGSFASLPERFPDEKLTPEMGITRLTVVFTEPHLSSAPQVETIDLPREGDSTSALFVVHPRDGITRMEARIVVLQGNRVLQTAILRADIVPEPEAAPVASSIKLVPEVIVSPPAEDPEGRQPFNAALLLDRGAEGGGLTTISGEYVAQVSFGETDIVVRDLADKLSAVLASESTHQGLESDAAAKLLRVLAHQGRLLYDALFTDTRAREAVSGAPRIQVVSARPGAFLPVEFIYEKRVPDEGARVCPNAQEALRDGQCQPRCPKGKDIRTVICPLGFWGLSRVIERQSDGELPQGKDFGVRLSAGPKKRLRILDSALFAASRRVDAVEESAATALEALREAIPSGRVTTAESWERWEELVASAKPSLLVLLTHTETSNTPVRALEIGDDKLLAMSAIYPEHVRASDDMAPVVLLIGCRTSVVDKKFQEFPVVFQRNGAAIVLGTVASILGRDAGPVTARLIRALHELLETREISFGDALLEAKRRLFAEGYLAAMSLCAHGDAAWILSHVESS